MTEKRQRRILYFGTSFRCTFGLEKVPFVSEASYPECKRGLPDLGNLAFSYSM